MKTTAPPSPVLPRDEIERRTAEYRRLGHERRSPAVMVYPPGDQMCPWAGCGLQISGIDFQLDRQGDAAQREKWLAAWWEGPGLVARCPGCDRYVLFGYQEKFAVEDPAAFSGARLPDNWVEKAQIAPRPQAS